jgi:hypothetical protein
MKIFYLILAHTNLSQVNRMINALRHEQAEFYIHFDVRVPLAEIKQQPFFNRPGINISRTRHKINWGGFNMVRATLSMMRAVCKRKETGYLVLLSGQDFPIKSPVYIYNFLKENYGREYLEYWALPSPKWNMNNGLDRILYYWFIDTIGIDGSFVLYQMQQVNNLERSFFDEFTPHGGSQWWCITTDLAAYILKFLRFNKVYETYFEHAYISDETFFNTLILNSPFQENTVNNNLKLIDWRGSAHPHVFTMDDWPALMGSDKLWARKFVDNGNSTVLEHLEAHIGETSIIP